ncbi:MAG: hypothetical protein J1F11_08275 [Oscillospiraceae bacterium]|nr:hypothetical protein [Oscillospiraceae bacterium]
MSEKRSDHDVLEIDLPAYEEDSFAVPDIEPESSFAENKEEIYRRNRLIAADMQTKELTALAEEEKARADKKAELEELYIESAAAVNYHRSIKIIFSVLSVMFSVVITVLVILFVQMSGNKENVSVFADAEEVIAAEAESEEVSASENEEVTTAQAVTSEKEDVIEPFVNDGSALVYNTEIMSYRFEPHYTSNLHGEPRLEVYISVKNLTDEEYFVVPKFIVRWGDSQEYSPQTVIYARDNKDSDLFHEFYPEVMENGKWVKSDYSFVAYEFGSDHLCNFQLTFFDEYEFDVFETFLYAPSCLIDREHLKKVDEDFSIPFEELKKYIKESA